MANNEFDTSDATAPRGDAPLSMRDKLDRDIIAAMRELSKNVQELTASVDGLVGVTLEQIDIAESDCPCPCHETEDDGPKGMSS